MAEYKLPFTAQEIEEKLGNIVSLDKTLTQAGYAADARAVGDRLAAIGNGGGGMSIKKIEFTDRPTAQNWFVENSGKVLKTEFEYPDLLVSFASVIMVDDYDIPSATFIQFSYLLDNGNVSVNAIELRISKLNVRVSFGTLGTESTEMVIEDEQWEEFGIKFTVYYIAEGGDEGGDEGGGESGDEGGDDSGDSPSCSFVVINNSTDAIEVSTKKMIENNEVVDAGGTNFGYGEYIVFENTQKGSVATLKTTLPCIVRDGDNHDIVYSNSEYVEVDEANQMTYVTIPRDSATVEIVVGE